MYQHDKGSKKTRNAASDGIAALIRESEEKDMESLPAVVEEMERFYRQMKLNQFFGVYKLALKVSFSYKSNPKAIVVQRLLGLFAVRLIQNDIYGHEDFMDLLMDLMKGILVNYILYVRKSACKFLGIFVEKQITLPEKVHDQIRRWMMQKLLLETDVDLRKEGANVLCRLQNSEDPHCPIIKCFYTLISADKSSEIRRYLLPLVIITNEYLNISILATKDLDKDVRKAAFNSLKKLPINHLSANDRTQIIFNGLLDPCEEVKEEVKLLLKTWLESYEGKHISLINSFDLEFKLHEQINVLLKIIFEISEDKNLAAELSLLLNKDRVIPVSDLNLQNVLFWKNFLMFYANSMQRITKYFNIPDYDDLIAGGVEVTLLPDITVLCRLIREFYVNNELCNPLSSNDAHERIVLFWQHYLKETVMDHLLKIFELYDFSDEVGRKELHILLFDILQFHNLEKITITVVTKLYLLSSLNIDEGIERIIKTIDYLCMKSFNEKSNKHMTSGEALEKHGTIFDTFQRRNSDREANEVIRKIPMAVIVKCMLIVLEMMFSKHITKLNSCLYLLFEEFVLSVLVLYREDEEIMSNCIVALSSFCLRDSNLAKNYMNTLISMPSNCTSSSTQCLFDMFVKYPVEELPFPDQPLDITIDDSEKDENMHPTFQYLLSLCDKKDNPLVLQQCILGICKMFITRKTRSPTIFSKLLLFYHDPARRKHNGDLQANIPVFFKTFNQHADYAIGIYTKAFIIALKKIVDTNVEGSNDQIDVEKFIEMMAIMINGMIVNCERENKLDHLEFQLIFDISEEILKSKSLIAQRRLLNTIMKLEMEHISKHKLGIIDQRLTRFRENSRDSIGVRIAKKVIEKINLLRNCSQNSENQMENRSQHPENLSENCSQNLENPTVVMEEAEKLGEPNDEYKEMESNDVVEKPNSECETGSSPSETDTVQQSE